MKIYLAAPIFNPYQLEVVSMLKNVTESYGHEVFSPYHASQAIWAGRSPTDCSPDERAEVLKGNIENLDCDLLLAWVGGYEQGFTDPGVIWEMGYAHCLHLVRGPYPYTLAYIDETDKRQAMNLMLAGTVDGVVKGYRELDSFFFRSREANVKHALEIFHPDRHLAHEKDPIV